DAIASSPAVCSATTGAAAFVPPAELLQQRLDAVEGGQDERDRVPRDRRAGAKVGHERLGRMGQRFEPRQSGKATSSFDGMNEAKDVFEYSDVVRLLFEAHQHRGFRRSPPESRAADHPWRT